LKSSSELDARAKNSLVTASTSRSRSAIPHKRAISRNVLTARTESRAPASATNGCQPRSTASE
jgi:hypothetical protein